jgi:adenylate cyclase
MTTDWNAEGMLDGLQGDARAERIEMLDLLHSSGFSLEDLTRAATEDRLALLPVERVLTGDPRYTLAQAAERADVDEPFLLSLTTALGLPVPAADDVAFDQEAVDAARAVARFRQAGLPDAGLLELAMILGDAMIPVTEGIRRLVGESLLHAGDTEQELGVRYERAALELLPLLGSLPQYVLSVQLREQVRHDVVGGAERASGQLPGTLEMAVAFADLVGFTSLGERVSGAELARMAAQLSTLSRGVAKPPVRFVKTIGDAVMLVSPDVGPLVGAMLTLVDVVEAEDDLPSLRAGVAVGPVINRWGDWYGGAVNLASRVTEHALPASVLVTKAVREAAGEQYSWSRAGSHSFKNVSGRVSLHRARLRGPERRPGDTSETVAAGAAAPRPRLKDGIAASVRRSP